jgi:hypothetical protein
MAFGKLNGAWLFMQVVFPLGGPVGGALLCLLFWNLGPKPIPINFVTILSDVTPWALLSYSLTLIGINLYHFWTKIKSHMVLTVAFIGIPIIGFLFFGYLTIWGQTPGYNPSAGVYSLTVILTIMAIGFCHECNRKP